MTETTMRAPALLRAVFVMHGLITLAGAVVAVLVIVWQAAHRHHT